MQKRRQDQESASFVYKIAQLQDLGTLILSVLAQPAAFHSSRQTHKVLQACTRMYTLAHTCTHTYTLAQNLWTLQDLADQPQNELLDCSNSKGKNVHLKAETVPKSVPKGIRQTCWTEHKAGELTPQLRKASKNSTHSGQFFLFCPTGSKISDSIRIAIGKQGDFKPGLEFLFQICKAKLKVQQKKFKYFRI